MAEGAVVTTFSYDAAGNQTGENVSGSRTTYTFDSANRLTGVLNADGTRSTYTYQADGLRRSAIEPGGSLTTFVWDGSDYLEKRS